MSGRLIPLDESFLLDMKSDKFIKNDDCMCFAHIYMDKTRTYHLSRDIRVCEECTSRQAEIKKKYDEFEKAYPNINIPIPGNIKINLSDGKILHIEYDNSRVGIEFWYHPGYWKEEPLEWWIPHLTKFEISP